MTHAFIAKIYFGDKEISCNSGDDVEKLYLWMLTQSTDTSGDLHGEIIDNKTQKVVKKFRKCPPD